MFFAEKSKHVAKLVFVFEIVLAFFFWNWCFTMMYCFWKKSSEASSVPTDTSNNQETRKKKNIIQQIEKKPRNLNSSSFDSFQGKSYPPSSPISHSPPGIPRPWSTEKNLNPNETQQMDSLSRWPNKFPNHHPQHFLVASMVFSGDLKVTWCVCFLVEKQETVEDLRKFKDIALYIDCEDVYSLILHLSRCLLKKL